jgi:hypothetical protein
MENRGSIVACIAGVPLGESVCDYASWWSKSVRKSLKLLHTIEHETANPSTDLSGSLGLGDKDELLSEYVALEHEQSRLSQKKARVLLETAKIRAKANGVEDPQLVLRHGKLQDNLLDLVK